MSTPDKARPSVANQPSNFEPSLNDTIDTKSPVRRRRGAALLLATGVLLAGCGDSDNTEPRAETSTSTSTSPAAEQSPDAASPERIDPPAELSPDAIRDLTPEEMTERFQIRADSVSTPEEFVEAYVTRSNAFYKLGCTEEEWGLYEDAPRGGFVDAMHAKYFAPVAEGLNGFIGNDYNHKVMWNRCNMMFTGELDNYSYNTELMPGTVTSEQNPDGTFNVTFQIHAYDNFGEIKALLGDIADYDSADEVAVYQMTRVHANDKGALVADSITVDSIDE